jgi:hypothetical protein
MRKRYQIDNFNTPFFGVIIDASGLPENFDYFDDEMSYSDNEDENFPGLFVENDDDSMCIGVFLDKNPEKFDFLASKDNIRRLCSKYKITIKEDDFGFYSLIDKDL